MAILENVRAFVATCGGSFIIYVFAVMLLFGLRRKKLLIGYLCFAGLCVGMLFLLFIHTRERMQQFLFCIEYAHLPLLLYLLWKEKDHFKSVLLSSSREEKCLFVAAALLGCFSILLCSVSNPRYIYPCNTNAFIGNYYFDADTGRGIISALSNAMPDMKHPLYRFVLNLFLIPCVLLFHVLGHANWYIGGYYLAFLQVVWNALSAVFLYKIILREISSKKLSICAVVLYMVSAAFPWTAMLPETFSLAVCTCLLALYLIQRDSPLAPAIIVLAAGLNLFLGIICIPYLFKKAKELFPKYSKILLLCGVPAFLLCLFLGKNLLSSYMDILSKWSLSVGFADRMESLWPSVFSSGFLGPHTMRVGPYYMQTVRWDLSDAVVLAAVVLFMLPLLWKRKSVTVWSVLILVLGGIILHGVFGFGGNVGFIYSPLYLPAVVILMACGAAGYRRPKIMKYGFSAMAFFVCICSLTWLLGMGRSIKNTAFPITDWCHPKNEFTLGTVRIHYAQNTLSADGQCLVEGVDSIQVSEKEGQVVGTTANGRIYCLTVLDGECQVEYLQ